MKQEISVLMDSELFEDEAEQVFDRIRRNPDVQKDWALYHLIGDVLRQPEHIHCELGEKIRERLRDEPVVLAPRRRAPGQRIRAVVLSAAASLAAIGVVAWMSVQIAPETVPRMAMQQAPQYPASAPMLPRADDYLMAHQEFSPSTDMNGSASYIRAASYRDAK